MTTAQPTLRTYLLIYALLMLGLAATVGAAYIPLGRMNLAVAMAIAFAKAALVVLFFMHVLYSPRLTWIAVFAGLVWLAILLALVGADYATRGWIPVEPPVRSMSQPERNDESTIFPSSLKRGTHLTRNGVFIRPGELEWNVDHALQGTLCARRPPTSVPHPGHGLR